MTAAERWGEPMAQTMTVTVTQVAVIAGFAGFALGVLVCVVCAFVLWARGVLG